MRKKIVAGNWKMNTSVAEGKALASAVAAGLTDVPSDVEIIIAPPFTHLVTVAEAVAGSRVKVSAQNCADEPKGAFTGEVSASMLSGAGCKYVILGHSERRQYYGETSEKLVKKMRLALAEGLKPIYCVGEKLEERNAGNHFTVVGNQLAEVLFELTPEEAANVVVAYEPVWAIGTGVTATSAQAQEIHAFIRNLISEKYGAQVADDTSILYGGSCKPGNAKELFANPDVDGGLIGGACLNADDFLAIALSF